MTTQSTIGPRPLTPGQKIRTVSDLWWTARAFKVAMLRSLHPEWSEDRLRAEVRRAFLLAR
jgi:hypothetical protein